MNKIKITKYGKSTVGYVSDYQLYKLKRFEFDMTFNLRLIHPKELSIEGVAAYERITFNKHSKLEVFEDEIYT